MIAILALISFYYLMNRVDRLVRELDEKARQVIELVSSESIRPGGLDRRHGASHSGEPLRQETRVY
jgi:biopolymer transport protein ExbB